MPLSTSAVLHGYTPDEPLDGFWRDVVTTVDFAYQPIVNIHTGAGYGFEALLRDYQHAGFANPGDFFDACHASGVLPQVEAVLHDRAAAKFQPFLAGGPSKLFLNVDVRGLAEHAVTAISLPTRQDLLDGSVVLEISEKHQLVVPELANLLRLLRAGGYRIALDDFGAGFSGLQSLYSVEPELIKIDRFFIAEIGTDSRKRLLLSQMVSIAHLLGLLVVAEGVETEDELLVCRDTGCDLVQGYLIQRPQTDMSRLQRRYDAVARLGRHERRTTTGDQRIISAQIAMIEPFRLDAGMETVFERFRAEKGTFFPVVDAAGEPVGIVHERTLKEYAYSMYGRELISNRALGRTLKSFVTRCPIADANSKAEAILQAFTADHEAEGIVIVENMKYLGFLSAQSLLRVINEKNLAAARDQNPLTKLPGNNLIHQYVSNALSDGGERHVLVYFDFDCFKPFNDKYGFRLGDRAILLFAELMAKALPHEDCFIGHVGGDDFFAGFKGRDLASCVERTAGIIRQFSGDVQSFYSEEDRRAGFIDAHDRDGNARRFPLLGVSAAVLELPRDAPRSTVDEIGRTIADIKKAAKQAPAKMCVRTWGEAP